jgi:hypothetical protein
VQLVRCDTIPSTFAKGAIQADGETSGVADEGGAQQDYDAPCQRQRLMETVQQIQEN